MGNLREMMEHDLGTILEDSANGFGLPVVLISPLGARQELTGRVVYARFEIDPATGMSYRMNTPMVTLRKSSLTIVPHAGERWAVQIPIEPSLTSDMETYFMELAPQSGDSYPWISLVLMSLEQEEGD